MTFLNTDDKAMRDVLEKARVIAIVGLSDNPHAYSYEVAQFLQERGYKIYPVNPNIKRVLGEKSYPSLKEVPELIDIVEVFRPSEYLPGIVDEAIAVGAKTVWAQLEIMDGAAKDKALEVGLNFSMNRCMKIETLRLLGE